MFPLHRLTLVVAVCLGIAISLPIDSTRAREHKSEVVSARVVRRDLATDLHVMRVDGYRAVCGDPTEEERALFSVADFDESFPVIYPGRANKDEGLSIVLQGTPQLQNFPAARDAFIVAAQRWEAVIKNPITLVFRVDFGPQRFGQPYPDGVIGSTFAQTLTKEGGYDEVRQRLVVQAASRAESEAMATLPSGTISTDLGPIENIIAASAVFRALGMINPIADPTNEEEELGPTPSIGFNSAFNFDFAPDNGITAGAMDFDAVTTHEIGHALGFTSRVGTIELNPDATRAVSTWDLFRVRPGATLATLPTRQRILSSGGEQFYFVGSPALGLSTGRPNAEGGDGRQASHWKDDVITRTFIGIMDPTLDFGVREEIQPTDVLALDMMGYAIVGGAAPVLSACAASLRGDVLTISGAGSDADGGTMRAQVALLDSAGAVVSELEPRVLETAGATEFGFSLDLSGLGAVPAATRVRVTIVDGGFNASTTIVADFSGADPGAPTISNVTRKSSKKVILSGASFSGVLQLEVNGAIVTPRSLKPVPNGTKLKVGGTNAELGLLTGPNRVRVIAGDGLRSNIFVFTVQ